MSTTIVSQLIPRWILSSPTSKIIINNFKTKGINTQEIITPKGKLQYGIAYDSLFDASYQYHPFIYQYNDSGELQDAFGHKALYESNDQGFLVKGSYCNGHLNYESTLYKKHCTGDIFKTEIDNTTKYHYSNGILHNPYGAALVTTDNDITTKVYTNRRGDITKVKNLKD